MSSGSNLIINPLERARSEDINNLQSVQRSRNLADVHNRGFAYPSFYGPPGSVPIIGVGGSSEGATNGVLGNSLRAAFAPPAPITSVEIGPGALVRFLPGAAPTTPYDANLYEIGRNLAPTTVAPGTNGGSVIPPAGLGQWLLCGRIVSAVTVNEQREVFNPATQQFDVVPVPKLREGSIEFQFFDASLPNPLPYPGDEWHPLYIVNSNNGQLSGFVDCRQYADDGVNLDSSIDQSSVAYGVRLATNTLDNISFFYNGRYNNFGGSVDLTTRLVPGASLVTNGVYALMTFTMRRVDGSRFRPPDLNRVAVGGANIVAVPFSSGALEGYSNTLAIEKPTAFNEWDNWLAGTTIQPGDAQWFGTVFSRATDPALIASYRSGREYRVNSQAIQPALFASTTLNISGGAIAAQTVNLPAVQLNGVGGLPVSYRMRGTWGKPTLEFDGGANGRSFNIFDGASGFQVYGGAFTMPAVPAAAGADPDMQGLGGGDFYFDINSGAIIRISTTSDVFVSGNGTIELVITIDGYRF